MQRTAERVSAISTEAEEKDRGAHTRSMVAVIATIGLAFALLATFGPAMPIDDPSSIVGP